MLGYKYNTEKEAIDARKAAADYYGIPVNSESTTLYFVDYQKMGEFYYIIWCEGCTEALGEPMEMEVEYELLD
jgi:hypothetical protein